MALASTDVHQAVRAAPAVVKDMMGWEREEELPLGGPHLASARDYAFAPAAGPGAPDVKDSATWRGAPVIDAAASADGAASGWYTVYGVPQDDQDDGGNAALRIGAAMAAVGSVSFYVAMRQDLHA